MSSLAGALARRGLVAEDQSGVSTGGRPATRLRLTPATGLAAGVDLGRTHVRVAVVDLGHRVLAERTERLPVADRPDEALAAAARMVDQALAESQHQRSDLLGVGLGVPAPLDGDGQVGAASILPRWVGHRPATELAALLQTTVCTENDANLGALAEALWGSGQGARLMVYVKASTGVGAGIVVQGQLFRGVSGTAGELGHTTVTDHSQPCACGNRGCLELQVGGPALLGRLRSTGLELDSLDELVLHALNGEPRSYRALLDAGEQIGAALANLVNVLNPDVIVFGGALSAAGELVLDPLRARMTRSAIPSSAAAVTVRTAALGDRATALGGALLVIREIERFDVARFFQRWQEDVGDEAPPTGAAFAGAPPRRGDEE